MIGATQLNQNLSLFAHRKAYLGDSDVLAHPPQAAEDAHEHFSLLQVELERVLWVVGAELSIETVGSLEHYFPQVALWGETAPYLLDGVSRLQLPFQLQAGNVSTGPGFGLCPVDHENGSNASEVPVLVKVGFQAYN